MTKDEEDALVAQARPVGTTNVSRDAIRLAIRAAVAQERERAAGIAEYIAVDEKPDSGPFSVAQRQTCQLIASLIRKGD